MNKEDLKSKLKKYDYQHKDETDKITVRLDTSLEIEIDYNQEGKLSISDRLVGLNPLTGFFEMSIRAAIRLNGVLTILFFLSFSTLRYFIRKPYINFMCLLAFILYVGWVVLWSNYYFTKSENFKNLIRNWDK